MLIDLCVAEQYPLKKVVFFCLNQDGHGLKDYAEKTFEGIRSDRK